MDDRGANARGICENPFCLYEPRLAAGNSLPKAKHLAIRSAFVRFRDGATGGSLLAQARFRASEKKIAVFLNVRKL
jgi:hypothetical protein